MYKVTEILKRVLNVRSKQLCMPLEMCQTTYIHVDILAFSLFQPFSYCESEIHIKGIYTHFFDSCIVEVDPFVHLRMEEKS